MENRITAAKHKLGLDDAGLAAKLGVHRTTVMRMERRGVVNGPAQVLLDQLLTDSGDHPTASEAA